MPTRSEILRLVDNGLSYETIGENLGILPGLAYLIPTGRAHPGGEGIDR